MDLLQLLNSYNTKIVIYAHNLLNHEWFLKSMLIFSNYIGNFFYSPIVFLLTICLMVINIKTDQHKGLKCYQSVKCFVVMLVSFVVAAIIVELAKHYSEMPRPFCSLPANEIISLPMHKAQKCLRSFPSGHSAYITILAASMFPIMNYLARIAGIIIVAMVYISRIALAMHFPIDVLTSGVMSLVIVWLVFKLYTAFEPKFKKKTKLVCELLTR